MTDSPEHSDLERGRWLAENRPELLGEIAARILEDSEWVEAIDPNYFADQRGEVSVDELLERIKKEGKI